MKQNFTVRQGALDGVEAWVTASIGIDLVEDGGAMTAEMLRRADVAMYRAKERGKGRHELYC